MAHGGAWWRRAATAANPYFIPRVDRPTAKPGSIRPIVKHAPHHTSHLPLLLPARDHTGLREGRENWREDQEVSQRIGGSSVSAAYMDIGGSLCDTCPAWGACTCSSCMVWRKRRSREDRRSLLPHALGWAPRPPPFFLHPAPVALYMRTPSPKGRGNTDARSWAPAVLKVSAWKCVHGVRVAHQCVRCRQWPSGGPLRTWPGRGSRLHAAGGCGSEGQRRRRSSPPHRTSPA